ncbi:ubiquitin carboxyl-terminal hydrolase 14-like protein [Dinothrombium tinctorium]|uniref:Ubiquitin carboxyl-terminal hydrolase n=1 Tax=Dinothrombium tinctorium TaxID=1965070 RepID=A0A3S3RZB5_9ACAR|nr:ubiquitin carboxyl-terminal hydrolase 14-like protein [Dinothrombium tinctorium]RWS08623.1 ubiquitin carboxyl-terminal hydrolase 14-like protein [Dinothrombium tinctorium]RWS08633.1 ubiquitin carboxyl-terminal hydrolase 14-like protein [Dinothrombium tinctorium]
MPQFKVKVKWGKELFDGIELNTDEEPIVFKAQLFALTGVKTDRQKVMFKGKVIGDETWINGLKDGATILMMGTADELPDAPKEKIVFMEDMTESELAKAIQYPSGLTNLGNSCYLNATVQCLRTVPELKEALRKFEGGLTSEGHIAPAQTLTAALRDLYQSMDKNSTVTPIILLQVLHLAFPRFAEKGEMGTFLQQDANECWTELMRILQQKLKPETSDSQTQAKKHNNFVEQYFGGTFDVTMKCFEDENEKETHSTEDFLQLSCFISQDVKYLQSGLRARLTENITKYSPSLGRDAQYVKTSKISRLPAYLTIQFVRFYYKERESVNAKILKDIKFSMMLDVFELCTEELQQKLIPMRTLFKEAEDKALHATEKDGKTTGGDQFKAGNKRRLPYSFPDDLGSNNSGYYELQAVLTHKGRSSSSGHYVAWVRRKGDEWFQCDDDTVTLVSSEDILKLSGGGDWHCAYVLLYGPRVLEIDQENSSEQT